ncbi:TolB family protein [Candidatus Poribacteria bacterium]|nr:TolB family protein [Candidatus Poribacteria bacterium]
MRTQYLPVSFVLSVVILGASVCPVLAKAPDTAKVVFASSRDGNYEIYLMNPDGSEQVNITNHRANDISAVWSPTGEHILFASDREQKAWGNWDLYLMEPDGSNVQKVFDKSKNRSGGRWSPDGKQIAYTSFEKGQWTVYIASIDDKKEEQVALGSSGDWSPDGTKLVMKVGWPKRMRIVMLDPQTGKQKFIFPPKHVLHGWEAASSGHRYAINSRFLGSIGCRWKTSLRRRPSTL